MEVGRYDLLLPGRIVFGWGRIAEIGALAAGVGSRALLVIGSRRLAADGFVDRLRGLLDERGVETVELAGISREPEVADVDAAVRAVDALGLRNGDFVLAVGGGSAIDLAKATAALATNAAGATVREFLEGVGSGRTIDKAPLPLVAVPTTAGTGSEATKNAVISSYDPPFKKSLRSDQMMPRAVLVDPQLTVSLPADATAHTGMDAITQLIESYLSRRATAFTQALAVEGLRLALPAIVPAVEDGASQAAREAMAQAALLSGMALANSGLGMAHGVAAALGVHARVAHGLACATMLPVALAVNRAVGEQRMAALARGAGVAPPGVSDAAAADALVARVDDVVGRLGIPRRLSPLNVTAAMIPQLVRDSRGNSMNGNPRELSDDELRQCLASML